MYLVSQTGHWHSAELELPEEELVSELLLPPSEELLDGGVQADSQASFDPYPLGHMHALAASSQVLKHRELVGWSSSVMGGSEHSLYTHSPEKWHLHVLNGKPGPPPQHHNCDVEELFSEELLLLGVFIHSQVLQSKA